MFRPFGKPSFDVRLEEATDTIVAGFAEFGLAGLTAADYLAKQLELSEVGHIAVDQLPAVTPFDAGTPRHHTRLFSRPDLEVTVLVGELFVPPFAAEPFGNEILAYAGDRDVEEVVALSGVPLAHGPDDHRTFYVASEDYQAEHFAGDGPVDPMPGGFLEGVDGALMQRGIDSPLRTCVLATPVHPQVPDVDAALRLLEAVDAIYELDLDTAPLVTFASEVAEHYEELAARLEEREAELAHEDRMYM